MTANADVTSANTVGFQTITVPADTWVMCATPFSEIGGQPFDLQNLISGMPTATAATGLGDGWKATKPQIQIQKRNADGDVTGTGYDMAYWISNAQNNPANTKDNETGWANGSKQHIGKKAAAIKLEPGTAYWFKDPNQENVLTFAGQVVDQTAPKVTVPADTWQMICNPFPVAIELNSVKFTIDAVATAATGLGDGWKATKPQIQIQKRNAAGQVTGTGYDMAYWISNAQNNPANTKDTETGWANGSKQHIGKKAAAITIPSGAGFWFKNPNGETVVEFAL